MMSNATATAKSITLEILFPNGGRQHYVLRDGASVIVGTGNNCGLKLPSLKVSPMHCILRLHEGELFVQDWCSASGTFIDDERISDETLVPEGSSVVLDEYRIIVVNGNAASLQTASKEETPARTGDGPDESQEAFCDDEEEVHVADAEHPATNDDSNEEPDRESFALERLPSSESNEISGVASDVTQLARPIKPRVVNTDAFDADTILLLQEEIETLQREIDDRDRQIGELTEQLEQVEGFDAGAGTAETEALVTRLEDLLDELARSDHRIRSLEELLRVSQEANQAEQEERSQIERWVQDIEHRISDREAEWEAERRVLSRKLADMTEQRSEIYEQLQLVGKGAAGPGEHDALVASLHKAHEQLRAANEEKEAIETELRQAQERLASTETKLADTSYQTAVEEAVKEERLKLAQERAALSRERAEMAKQVREHTQSSRDRSSNEADERFQALRSTLRELHAQDKDVVPVQKQSLGTRIVELWKRLDGPTDTD